MASAATKQKGKEGRSRFFGLCFPTQHDRTPRLAIQLAIEYKSSINRIQTHTKSGAIETEEADMDGTDSMWYICYNWACWKEHFEALR